MPNPRDFLDRFRPAPAPGAASRVGVPSDRARQLSAQLGPVLALLAATHKECEHIVATAHRDARLMAEQALREAAATTADAARRADTARDSATGEVIAAARSQAGQAAAAAARRARNARGPTDDEIGELVSTAVGLIMALGTEA